MAATTAMPISFEQLKMKEPTNDNLTGRSTQNRELQFLDIPKGDDLKIPKLHLENEFLLFEASSSLMGYLIPSQFPIDVFRDAFKHTQPYHIWIFQVVKLEIVAVAWIIFWAILSLCLPIGVLTSFCVPTNIRRLNEEFSNDSLGGETRRTENTLGCLLHVLLILMLCPLILILAGNEQISKSVSKTPASASMVYDDINTFLRNTHKQISFVITSSTDITVEEIRKDFEDIDRLLGAPYHQLLSTKTGLDVALVALEELKIETYKISSVVSELMTDCESARETTESLQDEIQEIARQLLAIQKQCNAKDRPLCLTIQFSGLDISLPLNELTNDAKIQQLYQINKDESFNTSIDRARKTYSVIPSQFVQELLPHISDTKSLLSRKRTEVYKSAHDLDILARTLSQEVSASKEAIFTLLENVVKWDLWRWLAILATAAVVALIWGLLICGAPCGCGVTSKTVPLLASGAALSCIVCVIMWALGTVTFLLGGHGQSLICQPFYDHPQYEVLSEFMDAGGVLYKENGLFGDFSSGNDSVKLADVLRGCQRDLPVFHAFHLQNKIDLERIVNYKTWEDLNIILEKFATARFEAEILGPELQLNLQKMHSYTAANFTSYRKQMSPTVTRGDLGTFADHINSVGRQLDDPVMSRKIDNLAFSVRKLVQGEMQRLNDLRGRILYKITTLEVLVPPLNRQVNQSLSHVKNIQFFLDNEGRHISEKARRQFIDKIENYLEKLYKHVVRKVSKEIGKCRPLWQIFHATRFHVCKLIFDPLSVIAFASYFLILVFIATTPIVFKLIEFYKESHEEDMFTSVSRRYIVLHAGNKNGFIPGAELVLSSKFKCDYHGEINQNNFLAWFENQLLKNLEEPSVIIMDNPSYHSTLVDKTPTSGSTKAVIKEWLTKHNLNFRNTMLKTELLQIVSRNSRERLQTGEEQIWTSPSTGSPEVREVVLNDIPSTWLSPPPRPPTVSSGIAVARIPQPPTLAYGRSPGRPRRKLTALASRITGSRGQESLRLIEPVYWRAGSTTPRRFV